MKNDLHKINDVIDNDVIILRPLSVVQKCTKQMRLIPLLMVIARDKTIPHTKQNLD